MSRAREKETVIHCPGSSHAGGESREANPKILLIAKRGSVGTFKVQCNSNRCKHSQGRDYNGWYEIKLTAGGSYAIQPLPRQHFDLESMPPVLLAGERR